MTDTETPKPTRGRPVEYRPEFCQACIDFMGQGFSLTAFAGSIGFCGETMTAWQATYPEFSKAVRMGRAARLQWLERGLHKAEGAQVTAKIFALKCACPDEWRDVQRTELTGKDGKDLIPSKLEELPDEYLIPVYKRAHALAGSN